MKISCETTHCSPRLCKPVVFLTFICTQTQINDPPVNLGVSSGQYIESPAVVDFLNPNYHYKSGIVIIINAALQGGS